ncbi:MAG: S4 domain-containing protein, partial [Methylobacteriaceae bacterium]
MKGRPPHRGSGAKRGPSGFAPRAGTGPRTSAKDAAQRAARNRGEDAAERSPWDDGAASESAPRPNRVPEAAAPKPDAPRARAKSPSDKPRAAKPSFAKPSLTKPDPAKAPPAEAPAGPTRREQRAAASATLASGVQTLTVDPDEAGMRIDRFLGARFPQLPFTRVQSIVRKGELRVDGKRAKPNDRLEPGSSVRVPPLKLDQPTERPRSAAKIDGDAEFLRSLILYEDADMMILNKPFGLAVQGGSGTVRHVDGLLEALTGPDGQRPRLVHRL